MKSTTQNYISTIIAFCVFAATAIILPEPPPQLDEYHVITDRQCNSCHENLN